MNKRLNVYMLPTEDINPVSVPFLLINGRLHKHLAGGEFRRVIKGGGVPQHLYFTTDEEIKEGDWITDCDFDVMLLVDEESGDLTGWKKIIATTNPKLYINKTIKEVSYTYKKRLPQPSQVFIEKYCKEGGIDEVDVEYTWIDRKRFVNVEDRKYSIKSDSHNTITIHMDNEEIDWEKLYKNEILKSEGDENTMDEQSKEIEVLKEFIDELINHSYMYGSDYYDSGMVLLNKTEDDE